MDYRGRFSILIVRGDGARVLCLTLPRRGLVVVGCVLAAVVFLLGAVVGDWWYARQRLREVAGLFERAARQQATLDAFAARLGDLRREIAGWQDLHARMREPFGPEPGVARRSTGIGGRGPALASLGVPPASPLDDLDELLGTLREQGDHLRALDALIARARRAIVAMPSRWPVKGAANSEFGARVSPWTGKGERHGGIDIGVPPGTLVQAPAPGVVVSAGYQADFGLTVTIDHGHDLRTVYAHLSRIGVVVGQSVERGAVIGRTGNTGRSSGPHLHYEIQVAGQAVNPRLYIWD